MTLCKVLITSCGLFLLVACGEGGEVVVPTGPVCQTPLCDRPTLESLGYHPFYRKYVDAGGIPVISSEKTQDRALLVAREIVEEMLAHRPDVFAAMRTRGAYVGIMSRDEVTTDIPEHAHLADDPDVDWDERARGLGGTPQLPITTAGEENLLCLVADRYRGENILVHEFAHAIHLIGIDLVEPQIHSELRNLHASVLALGLWRDTYAGSNPVEYWAEGVQSWFDANQQPQAGVHNHVDTRAELKEYDPLLSTIIERFMGDRDWRPSCPG
ncbi:MAG: hypothetical protein F4107_04535 [Gemmatimonadetes bacterium]|nr:hypothetical protein [Gemmatimonadota bacterium]MYI65195.1 hypothetical protein [Gemmatimonadota bacterium]